MMLSHPVLLGLLWSLLILSTSGQSQISNNESNKVYAYSYHFQHNGTTNSKDILRSVLGNDPEFGLDNPDGKSIVKTFSSPGIRGFFTKGVLPAGPISQSFFNNGINNSPYSAVKKFVESNLQPPRDVATGLLPPISPDISREFPGDFNNVNNLVNVFQDDFPKIPPPPPPVFIPNNNGNNRNVDFPKIPPPPTISNNNIGNNRNVESFSRETPDGGRIEGHVETFSYNSPPVSNSISRTEENSEGYRRNENILNNNREVTGHRTQSFFRTNFRTVTPNLDSHNYNEHSRVENRNSAVNNNNNNHNNNQWWNVLNVLGNGNNNLSPPTPKVSTEVDKNINEIQNNINRAFGARLSAFRRQNVHNGFNNNNNNINRQNNFGNQINNNYQNRNPTINQNFNNPLANQNFRKPVENQNYNKPVVNMNFNNPLRNQNFHNSPVNQDFNNILHNNRAIPNMQITPFNRADEGHNQQNTNNNNNGYSNVPNSVFNNNNPVNHNINTHTGFINNNNPINHNVNPNHQTHNNALNNNNISPQFNDDTQNKVMNLIHDVRSHLKDVHNNNQRVNNLGPTWDDDIPRNIHHDWSSRRRPFSNGHSGPANSNSYSGPANSNGHSGPQPMDILKNTFDALLENTNIELPRNQGNNNYRNVDGGGVEKFFGYDRTVEGPNSFSRNQQRGYERDFKVNSNSGYTRSNQWSTNTLRRLDAQSSKADFSTDFIDVFRDDK